jgi:hypothetical protein
MRDSRLSLLGCESILERRYSRLQAAVFFHSSAEVAPFRDFFLVAGSYPFLRNIGRGVFPTAAAVLSSPY